MNAYWHSSQLLKCPLPPRIVNQPFLPGPNLPSQIGSRRRLGKHATGQLEQAGRAMEGNAPVILNLEPFKILRQVLLTPFILLRYPIGYAGTRTSGRRRRGAALSQFRRRLG